jgi:hypothetical protein
MTAADTRCAAIYELRRTCYHNGYRPLAVSSPDTLVENAGKAPIVKDWLTQAQQDPPWVVGAAHRVSTLALNTGLLTGELSGLDVDVMIQDVVDRIVSRIEQTLGSTPLSRIGNAPKILLCYRAAEPFKKLSTQRYQMPDGSKAHFEILGAGQQVVAFGIHPNTRQPYHWLDRSPADMPLAELPTITFDQAADLIDQAEAILEAAGGVPEKPAPKPKPPPGRNGNGDNFFRNVNNAALEAIEKWVQALHPDFRDRGNSGWRLRSRDLGRDLQEDISVHPSGIQDFGEEKPLTAIDLIVKLGAARDPTGAAFWLCEKLEVEPATLGWHQRAIKSVGGETLDDFYAYLPSHKFIYVPTRELWLADSVNARFPMVTVGTGADGEPIKLKPSIHLARTRPVQQMTWFPSPPGEPPIIRDLLVNEGGWFSHPGATVFNLYAPPPRSTGDPKNVKPWLDHVKKLYPDDFNHIVCWFAHRVQKPWEKINHALVLGGDPRIGKDTMIEPVKRAIGHWNFKEASPTQVMGRFNGFVKGVILRISETRDLGETDRYAFYEHMKTYIAAPPDVLRVDEKNIPAHAVFNVVGVIETTNHGVGDAMYLPANDGRHYVAWTECKIEDFAEEYWTKLWRWYDLGGAANVAAYLAQPERLEGFNAKAPPPKTSAFWDIVNAHAAPEEAELGDILRGLIPPFYNGPLPLPETYSGPDIVTLSRIAEKAPTSVLGGTLGNWLQDRRNSRQIPHRMKACGYIPVRNPSDQSDGRWVIAGKRQVVYGKAELRRSDLISLINKAIDKKLPSV